MGIGFPDEFTQYRKARNTLLDAEIKLRRAMEAVAEARRALPPGGLVPEDYVFDGLGADGWPARIKLSELFVPGKDTLIVYNMMFPRHPKDDRPTPEPAKPRSSNGRRGRALPARVSSTSSTAQRRTWKPPASISW